MSTILLVANLKALDDSVESAADVKHISTGAGTPRAATLRRRTDDEWVYGESGDAMPLDDAVDLTNSLTRLLTHALEHHRGLITIHLTRNDTTHVVPAHHWPIFDVQAW